MNVANLSSAFIRRAAGLSSLAVATVLALPATACNTVKPWQRETLADPIMQPDRSPMASALIDHVYFSRGRTVGGGGCGCN
jgi:hypothetical protein